MKRIAKFEKVSLNQYIEDMNKCLNFNDEKLISSLYEEIVLPNLHQIKCELEAWEVVKSNFKISTF